MSFNGIRLELRDTHHKYNHIILPFIRYFEKAHIAISLQHEILKVSLLLDVLDYGLWIMHVELIQELYADRSEPHKAVDESESVIKSLDFVNEDLEIFLQKLWRKK